jgi:hypothetical protein
VAEGVDDVVGQGGVEKGGGGHSRLCGTDTPVCADCSHSHR